MYICKVCGKYFDTDQQLYFHFENSKCLDGEEYKESYYDEEEEETQKSICNIVNIMLKETPNYDESNDKIIYKDSFVVYGKIDEEDLYNIHLYIKDKNSIKEDFVHRKLKDDDTINYFRSKNFLMEITLLEQLYTFNTYEFKKYAWNR